MAVLEALPLIVREARRARRATLADVTAQTGVAQSTLSRLERPMLRVRRSGDTSAISLGNAIILLRWLDQGQLEGESDS
jgi:transcriptional regulator with XRE-family HTH domain